MIYYLYDMRKEKDKKIVSCLCLKEDNGVIVDSKIIKEEFALNQKLTDKWSWASTASNHFYIGHSDIPDKLLSYVKILQESLDSELKEDNVNSVNVVNENEKDLSYKKELSYIIRMFTKFIEYSTHPEKTEEFKEFEDFIQKHNLKDYLIEDWLLDMQEIYEKNS